MESQFFLFVAHVYKLLHSMFLCNSLDVCYVWKQNISAINLHITNSFWKQKVYAPGRHMAQANNGLQFPLRGLKIWLADGRENHNQEGLIFLGCCVLFGRYVYMHIYCM